MSSVAALALAGVAVLLLLWLLETVIRRSDVGLAAVLLAVAVSILGVPAEVSFGGLLVTGLDVLAVLLGVAAVARLLRGRAVAPLQWLIIALLVAVASSVLAGISTFGLGTAVNEARSFVQFLTATLYLSTAAGDDEQIDRLVVPWATFAAFLLVLTMVRWAGLAAGVESWWMGDESGGTLRVIDSFSTLVVLEVLLIAWGARRPVPRLVTAATPVLLAALVLLQHRTLWVALAVAALVLGVRRRQIARRMVPAAVVAIVVGAVLAFTVFGDPTSIREDLETSATNADTFEWRVEGWRQLVFDTGPDTPTEELVGLPFGAGFDRRIQGQVISVSPHNLLVHTYLRMGLVGLGLLVSVYLLTIRGLLLGRVRRRYFHDDVLLAIMAVQVLFMQTSHFAPDQGLLLGIAISTAIRATGQRREGRRRSLTGDARAATIPAANSRAMRSAL